jgi:5-methylcytosine-specific restriction protein A
MASKVQVERIRGRALQALRNRLLSDHPLCVMCLGSGRVKAATELDHIIALTNGGSNDDTNLQGLCADCHKAKTTLDLGHRQRCEIGIDGWPVVEENQTGRAKGRSGICT